MSKITVWTKQHENVLKELKNISRYIACKLLFMHHKNIKIVNIDKIGKVQVVLWQIKKEWIINGL